jgi:predicted nucleic acid-binding protein
MSQIVVDASVTLRALLDKDEKIVRRLKSFKSKLLTSPIFFLECANAIKHKYTNKAEASEALDVVLKLNIDPVELNREDLRFILKMASENNATTYDTSYHYLAIKYDGVCITSDKKYFQLARHLEHIELWG